MDDRYLMSFFAFAAGLFSCICAYKDYDWFMNHPKARFMINIMGRKGARIFYLVFGVLMILVGLVVLYFGLPATSSV